MDATLNKLPKDSKSLQEMVIDLRETVAEKTSKLKHQKDLIDQLLEAIRLSKHQHFGTRSEKFNAEQLDFLLNEIGVPAQGDTLEETDSDESERRSSNPLPAKKAVVANYPTVSLVLKWSMSLKVMPVSASTVSQPFSQLVRRSLSRLILYL